MTFAEILLLQLAVLVAGTAVGWIARVRLMRAEDGEQQADRLGESLAFVGGALGILLGLLLVFAVGHFEAAQQSARDEAGAITVVFNAVDTYAVPERDGVRRDLICYARSVVADDWPDLRESYLRGSDETYAWAERVQRGVADLTLSTDAQSTTHQFAVEHQLLIDQARQSRLQLGVPEIPRIIWLVILVSSFAFIALLEFHLTARWPIRIMAAGAVILVVMVSTATLYELDRPYAGWSGSALQPTVMQGTLAQLQDGFPAADWSPCPRGIADPNA